MIPDPPDEWLREMEEEIVRHDACEHDWQPAPELGWLGAQKCSKCGWGWLFAVEPPKGAAGGGDE